MRLLSCLLLVSAGTLSAQVEVPANLAEAQAELVVERIVDQYLQLRSDVIQPAVSLGRVTHRRDAERALVSLEAFLTDAEESVTELDLGVQARIDWMLLETNAADLAAQLRASLIDEAQLRALLPAAGLMEDLPDLTTGMVAAADRHEAMALLSAARDAIPAPWATLDSGDRLSLVRAAVTRAKGVRTALSAWMDRADNWLPEPDSLRPHVEAVREGLAAFAERLDEEVIPALEETDAAWGSPVGRERFVALLRNRHMVNETPEELLEWGRAQLDSIEGEIAAVARRIDRRATPREVWERLKDDHPARADLPSFAYGEMQRSLELLLATGVVTIPEDARRNVMRVTEGRTWDTYPFGGYGGFRREGDEWVGSFLTSPPPVATEEEVATARLRGNNYYWARVVAVHEIYPGHHLQWIVNRTRARRMRRNYYTTTLGEGWGLYSEQLMYRLGFFDDDETQMAMLLMRAWRAARVIIDVGLHLGEMGFDEAVAFLMEHVDMDEANATAEVRRYLGNPTRPLSYLYGYNEIEELRRDYMAVRGEDFDPREFHDTLLSYGAIPIPLIRAGMLGEPFPD